MIRLRRALETASDLEWTCSLFVDAAHVETDGVDADVELAGGSFMVVAFDQQGQDPNFVRCELMVGLIWGANLAE